MMRGEDEHIPRKSASNGTDTLQSHTSGITENAPADFEYVLKDAEQLKVSFGSTTPRNIGIYGKGAPHSRIIFKVRRETDRYSHLGPTSYDTPTRNAFYNLFSKATSIHGVGTGARKSKRFPDQGQEVPGPGEYHQTKPCPRQNLAPFNSSSRKKSAISRTNNPGPATYQGSGVVRLLWKYHFGLAPREPAPLVSMRCTNGRPLGKCSICDEELPPGKEYWRNSAEKLLLCIRCMREEKQATVKSRFKARFSLWQLQAFQRERDCTDYHEHEGTTAKIHLIPDSVIQKRIRLEAYLGRFFADDGPPEDPDRDKRPAVLGNRPEQKREETADSCAYLKNRPDCIDLCLDIPSLTITESNTTTTHLGDLTCFDDNY